MPRGLSLHLDLLRFAPASVVLLGHSTYRGFTAPGFLWFIFRYGQTAVIGFFVLSGFVIAHVVARREQTAAAYAGARLARLYSVVIPALLLTFALDTLGIAIAPAFYQNGPSAPGENQPLRYVLSFFLVQNFAAVAQIFGQDLASFAPGTNWPFWSMSYEAAYYALFGIAFFLRGHVRIVAFTALALLAGPAIMALFPLWLLGAASWRWRDALVPAAPWGLPAAVFAFVGSAALLAVVGWYRVRGVYDWPITTRATHQDYAEGVLFAVHLLAAYRLSGWLETLWGWCAPIVRWLGSLTFTMYLCHLPLLYFFAIPSIGTPIGTMEMLRLFASVIAAIIVMTWLTERLRLYLRGPLTAPTA